MNLSIPQSKALIAAMLGLVAVVAAAVVLIASTSQADSPVRASETTADDFGVLSSSDIGTVPGDLSTAVSAVKQMTGLPIDTVGVAELASGDSALVAATGSYVCVASAGGNASCGEESLALSGELFGATSVGCDAYHVVGLVPDGVSELSVEGQDAKTIPVNDNVYSATLAPVDTTLSSNDGSVSISVPLGWYAKDNSACS
jgi:hypothetical protein